MPDSTCSVEGCERPIAGRGWCAAHYSRWRRLGSVLAEKPIGRTRAPAPVLERLWRNLEVSTSGCWTWTGAHNGKGYGFIRIERKNLYTHRVMYELTEGPIPDGYHLDHLCRNPPCCNPMHLEPVTPLENARRGTGHGTETHCPRGHPYSGDNLRAYRGKRWCRACRAEQHRRRRLAA